MKRIVLPLIAIAAASAATAATAQLPAGQPPLPPITGTRLDVTAEGEVARVPDLATISAGVVTQAKTAAEAMGDNAAKMAAASAALRRAGVADRDISTASISLQPQYRYAENQPPVLTGYQASNQLSVRFRDVKKAGTILDALVAQGINQINGPDFSLDKPEAALDEARVKAVQAARARAEVYAKAAGMRVGRIVSISESGGYTPPARPMMMQMARSAKMESDTAIEPGEQKLSVSVSVTFELN
jgi:uncharacterized protein YggE